MLLTNFTTKPMEEAQMSNKQQTAVEQLAIALYENGFLQGDGDGIQEIVEKAKEMERERIEKDYMSGYSNGGLDTCITPQQYYNETYGGNNEQQ